MPFVLSLQLYRSCNEHFDPVAMTPLLLCSLSSAWGRGCRGALMKLYPIRWKLKFFDMIKTDT
jgi:hypothetical protein